MAARVRIEQGATVYRRGPGWWLDYSFKGSRQRVSLKTGHRAQAMAVARQLVDEAHAKSWGVVVPHDVPFGQFFGEYREYGKLHHAPKTRLLNNRVIADFEEFARNRKRLARPLLLADVSRDDVEAFQRSRVSGQERVSNTTANIHLRCLSAFFNQALAKSLIRISPVKGVGGLPVERKARRPLNRAQVTALLARLAAPVVAHGPGMKGETKRDRITPLHELVLLILNTGLRLGEATHLEWSDLDFEDRLIHVRFKAEYKPKDREEREIRMNSTVKRLLQKRRFQFGAGRWVFPTRQGTPQDPRNLLRELKRIVEPLGLPDVNFYTFRHTFASESARTQMPPFILKSMMGHSSVRTTETYYVHLRTGTDWTPPEVK